MSTLKVNNLQVGQDATATNNFTLYQPAVPDGTVRLGVGNVGSVTDVFTVKNNRLGIGTNDPGQALSIAGSSVSLGIYNTGNNHGNVYFYKDGIPKGWLKYRGDDNRLVIGNVTDSINVLTDGNVGIGTTNPQSKLQIGSGGVLRLYRSDNNRYGTIYHSNDGFVFESPIQGDNIYVSSTNNDVILQTAGTTKLIVLNTGNVGIGTTNPDTTLHIEREVAQNDNVGILQVESRNENTGSATNASIIVKNKYGYSQLMQWESNGLRLGVRSVANGGTGDLILTAGADGEKLRITSTGNVGIGSTNPTEKLTIYEGKILVGASPGSNTTGEYELFRGFTYLTGGVQYGAVSLKTDYDAATNQSSLNFYVSSGGSNQGVERMRLTNTGLEVINDSSSVITNNAVENPRILIKNTNSSYGAGIGGGAIDFEGVFGGLGRLAVSKQNSGNTGTARDFGAFHLLLNSNVSSDSYGAFQKALIVSPGTDAAEGGFSYNWRGANNLRITHTGNVGIGTTNPNGKFEVITGSGNGGVLIAADGSSIHHSIVVNNNGDLTVGSRNTSADTKITSMRNIYNYGRSDERLVYGWRVDYGFFSTDHQKVWAKNHTSSVTYVWRDIWYAVYQQSSDFFIAGHAYRFYLFGSNGRHQRIYEGLLHIGDIGTYGAGTSGSYVSSISEIPGPYPSGCGNPFSNVGTNGFTYASGNCFQSATVSIMRLNNKYGIDPVT